MNSTLDGENELVTLEEGMVLPGVVNAFVKYGAFVDLGNDVTGLVHTRDMSWKRVQHPSEVVNIGDEIEVKVLKIDRERDRISLGIKQLSEDPWQGIEQRYPEGTRLSGKVTKLTHFGCFVEIEEYIEGLVHASDMDWRNKNVRPSKVVQVDDEVEVMVLGSDEERHRIALGIKQCQPNPWEEFAKHHNNYDKVVGNIASTTNFGIFVGLEGGIDGLVHLSDISWETPGEQAILRYQKDEDVEVVVLKISAERQRVSLGIKQLEEEALLEYIKKHPKGSLLKGTVCEIEDNRAFIQLADDIEGYISASEIAPDFVDDIDSVLPEGKEVEAKFIDMDWKKGCLVLSLSE